MGNTSFTSEKHSPIPGVHPNENKELISLMWLDQNIGVREDTATTMQQLREINDYIVFHTDLQACLAHIRSISTERVFVVTSGNCAVELLPQLEGLSQVDSIFVFCMKKSKYEHLLNEYEKIVGVFVDLADLCASIREQVNLVEKHVESFNFFNQHDKATKDLSKQSAEFLWFQLFRFIIVQLPHNEQAKNQMLNMCRSYYRGNGKELQLIDDFERQYRADLAIEWYSKESFVYKLINKALRSEDIDLLYAFRFYISDLSTCLVREHKRMMKKEEERTVTVYRGAKLSGEELNQLKENQGKLISANSYLSTSRLRMEALTFALKPTKRADALPVLFQIECNVQQVGDSVIFADIAQFSEFPRESEVLFDLSATFLLNSVRYNGQVWLITMSASNEGEAITRDYIEVIRREVEEKSVAILFGRLMCQMGQYEKSRKYFEQLLRDSPDEDTAWIEFNIGRALHYQNHHEQARKFYDQAYDRMMNARPPRIKDSATVLNNIGHILKGQAKNDEAFRFYQRALQIREKYYSAGHPDLAISLKNLGVLSAKLDKYDEALDLLRRALQIQQNCYPADHPDLAYSIHLIGKLFQKQGKFDEAHEYLQRALTIQEKHYPIGHPHTVISLEHIATLHRQRRDYDSAKQFYHRALNIQKNLYPADHLELAHTLSNIAEMYEKLGKVSEALDYRRQAAAIYKKKSLVDRRHRPKNAKDIPPISS